MKSIDFKAEMTIHLSDVLFDPGEHFNVWYFKSSGKITDLWSTIQKFYTPEAIVAEMFYAADSKSLIFSRSSNHLSGTLAKYYYENLQLSAVTLTATATAYRRRVVASLILRPVSIDRLIPNNKIHDIYDSHVDLVSLIADTATVYRDADHEQGLTFLSRDVFIERRDKFSEIRESLRQR